MVQIFKVAEHAERKRVLREQSDLYRDMLTAEVSNIGMSFSLMRRKYAIWKSLLAIVSVGTSVAGLVVALRGARKHGAAAEAGEAGAAGAAGGWMSRLMSGVQMMKFVRGVISKYKSVRAAFGGEEE